MSARVPFRGVLVLAWATLVTQILIVGTGGAVRLTASGLGCPTWPLCTDASLVPTPEMGIHGGIEFGNRLLSIVVGLVAVALVVFVLVRLRSRRDLLGPALAILALTVLQGLVGGLSVRVKLDPSVVGLHFVTSAVLVALATVVVYRAMRGRRGERAVPRWFAMLVHVTSAVVAATVVVGVLTTGSGPHAGDDASSRNGLDPELLQHIHSWPAYLTFALTLALVIAAYARRLAPRSFVAAMLGVELVQIAVGLTQANTGLPPLLVGTHMVLAVVLVSVTTATVLALRGVREGGA
ncbi:MAG TPA: COX15/CtaA family protein [Pseudolysinimonas sp.]|nr:COX15/CtaA family protein [Pseudolysinimonas sp.]